MIDLPLTKVRRNRDLTPVSAMSYDILTPHAARHDVQSVFDDGYLVRGEPQPIYSCKDNGLLMPLVSPACLTALIAQVLL